LKVGHYTVKAESPGFRGVENTGIVLEAGDNGRADVALEIRADFTLDVVGLSPEYGVSEYAAIPLKVEEEDWATKKKPFTYVVGNAKDHGTFKGIAQLVYSDPQMWVQIFEANRDVVARPGAIPAGTSILIPPSKRVVPKLIYKVMPVYPPAAEKEHARGDVVLEVMLKEDGSVEGIEVIDGNTLLAEAATAAVKQWRYRPLVVKGKPVVKFVVVVSFGKGGKVR
jgi:TonB family protein